MSENSNNQADLTIKEQEFVHFFLGEANRNATKAAQLAGYTGNRNVLGVTAHRLLKKPHVRAYIDQVMDEAAMKAREVLHRLANIARGSIDDVLTDTGVWFDLEKARSNGSIHLVKKLKNKRLIKETKIEFVSTPDGEQRIETSIISEEIEFEMYDVLAALRDLGKYHKLFSDKVDLRSDVSQTEVVFYMPDNFRQNNEQIS